MRNCLKFILNFSGFLEGIFWIFLGSILEDFFGRIFLGGSFRRIPLGGFFGEDFLGGFFGEDFFGRVLCYIFKV